MTLEEQQAGCDCKLLLQQ